MRSQGGVPSAWVKPSSVVGIGMGQCETNWLNHRPSHGHPEISWLQKVLNRNPRESLLTLLYLHTQLTLELASHHTSIFGTSSALVKLDLSIGGQKTNTPRFSWLKVRRTTAAVPDTDLRTMQ